MLADVKGKEVGDVGRTSVLIFFVPRLRDIQIETLAALLQPFHLHYTIFIHIHIHSTRLDSSYSFEAEGKQNLSGKVVPLLLINNLQTLLIVVCFCFCMIIGESDLDSEDCLGFLSSVALAHDQKWYNTHSGRFHFSRGN